MPNYTIVPPVDRDAIPAAVATDELLSGRSTTARFRKNCMNARARVFSGGGRPLLNADLAMIDLKVPRRNLRAIARKQRIPRTGKFVIDTDAAVKPDEDALVRKLGSTRSLRQLIHIRDRSRQQRRSVQYKYIKIADDTSDKANKLRAVLDALAARFEALSDAADTVIRIRTAQP